MNVRASTRCVLGTCQEQMRAGSQGLFFQDDQMYQQTTSSRTCKNQQSEENEAMKQAKDFLFGDSKQMRLV